MGRTMLLIGGVLLAALSLTGCQDLDGSSPNVSTGSGTTGAAPVTAPSIGLPSDLQSALPSDLQSDLPSVLNRKWIMPNLVGSNLQAAQNAIQKLTDYEVFYMTSHDVTGQGRHQLLDGDWKVCSQNVPAGAVITIASKIDFGTVKTAESCP